MIRTIYQFIFAGLSLVIFSCQKDVLNPIEKALKSSDPKIKRVVENMDVHEVQILFTEILSDKAEIIFKDYSYNLQDEDYFYPASSVKFPIAVLALEKLRDYPKIDRHTLFLALEDSVKTTVAAEIEKIFAVSDNVAYNKLFDFLGKDAINDSLKAKGLNAQISHKLATDDQKIYPVRFLVSDTIAQKVINEKGDSIQPLKIDKLEKGVGYIKGDSLINKPMDFSKKNYLPITTLHAVMKRILFPEKFTIKERFNLSDSDRNFLLRSMKLLPKAAGYVSNEYYDSYVKFLVFGDCKKDIPEHISIYNKVGYAYGYLTDCAYIVDEKRGKQFIITATVHVNKNGIYNDGIYEYEEIGIPFLAELGRELTGIGLN